MRSGATRSSGSRPTTSGEAVDAAPPIVDGATADADPPTPDADPPDAAPPDACLPFDDQRECTSNTCGNPPLGSGTPCASGVCDGAGSCVPCVLNTDCGLPSIGSCTMAVCTPQHACTIGPAPRDTLCNSNADQCDGAGHCVDCTTSGGCDECCACFAGVCLPV